MYLVESAVVTNGQYAVLSYVWGTSNTLRLEEAIQSKFQGGFAVDELPDTIQDAVMVTNSLGIGYLWVDSLCILQDSDTDKSREIPRMNDYYRNAHIVISASGARDVHSGFVPEQMSYGDLYAELQHPDPNRQSLTWPVPLRIPGHFPDHSSSLLVDALPQLYTYKGEPINNRAWTLQESVLPRRLLRFPTTGGLSMRCLEGEILAGEIVSDPYHEEPNFISLGLVSSNRHTGDELFELWTKMVEDYTQRSLSYRGDILIAIGALAREFHTKNGVLLGKYLGGFWEHHLRSGLLWHNTVDISKSWSEQQSQYLAPSWSWASCPSPISFRNKSEMHLPLGEFANSAMKTRLFTPRWYCKVLNFDVTPRNELDPFGALEAGYLTIQGPLRPPHRQPNDSSPRTERENKSQGCLDLYLVKFGAHVLILDRPLISSEPTETKQQQYFCLGLWYAGRGRARGLIVQQIDEKSFQRLGFAEYPVDDAEFPSSELHKERVIHLV